MHRVVPSGRGPSPWRGPRPGGPRLWPRGRSEWLLLAARLQLAAVLFYSLMLAAIGWMVYFADWSALECFDGTEPACTEPDPPFPLARFLLQSAAWAAVMAASVIAVVLAWRHRTAEKPRREALVALAIPVIAALVANRLADIPVPLLG